MNTNELHKQTIDILIGNIGNGILYFDDAVPVRQTRFDVYNIWATCVSPTRELFVSDNPSDADAWHKVEEDDMIVLPQLYQRVRDLFKDIKHEVRLLQEGEQV